MFGLSNFAAGANDELTRVLTEKFLQQIERQKMAQAERSLDMQGRRDSVNAELGRGNLGVAQGNLGLRGKEFDQGVKEYDEAKPLRLANLAHTQAQTGELARRPSAEEAARTHAVNLANIGHGHNMAEIGAQGQNALSVANVRTRPRIQRVTAQGPDGPVIRFIDVDSGDVVHEEKAVPTAATKTPEQIQAEAAARAKGTAEGKKEGGGGGIVSGALRAVFGGGEKPTTVKMKAPDGSVRDVPADQVAYYKNLGAVEVK